MTTHHPGRAHRLQPSQPAHWILALLLAAACLLPAHAAPKRVALLIGNSQYQFESSLPNPVRDVRLLAQSLRGLGFSAEVLENLPKREMDLAIKRFVRDSAGADTALLYYAGHGQQPSKGGRSFLLPVNANAVDDDQLEADGVPAEDIAAQLERLPNPARLRLVVLDACRNTRAVSRSTVRGLAPPARTDSFTLIAYSTDANAVAQDGAGQNSPYALALAKHLSGLGARPVRQVFEDTGREVRLATRQQQSPRTYGDLESRIGLDGVELASAPPEPKPPVVDAELQQWTAALRANTEAGYGEYLRAYPSGVYAGAARNALAAIKPQPVPDPRPGPAPAPVPVPQPQPGQVVKDCGECPELVVIPAGEFTMGSPTNEPSRSDNEGPQRRVKVSGFLAGRYEVTYEQWDACVAAGGCSHKPEDRGWGRGQRPVIKVSWEDAQQYVKWLSGKTGKGYRLLSEAEWEYVARAGTSTPFWTGQMISAAQANFDGRYTYNGSEKGEYRQKTVPVGSFGANAFGLYDTAGNVREWVQDVWHDNYSGAPSDGGAWMSGGDQTRRVLRGGSWDYFPLVLRSAIRNRYSPDYRDDDTGFRIARTY